MKVKVITLHRVYNYGSVLQAYATEKVIEKYTDADTEIIDYYSSFRTPSALLMDDGGYSNILKSAVYRVLHAGSIFLKIKTFGGFLKKECKLTKKYITYEDLVSDPPEADVYVTGSDQVWNSIYNRGIDKAFFLQFVKSNANKVAFVSSFGMAEIPESEKEETISYLNEYSAISVREDEAISILEREGLSTPSWLIDPTLQLSKNEWMSISSKRLVKEPYLVLMLLYNEDEGATEYARRIADERGLKLVKISWEIRKPDMIDILFTHRSPEDFISLFAMADFIVTNSFHGTAFAINLERQFVVVPRKEFNSRITSLLNLTNLSSRLVSSCEEAMIASEEYIEYSEINEILNKEREKAKIFIQKNIK